MTTFDFVLLIALLLVIARYAFDIDLDAYIRPARRAEKIAQLQRLQAMASPQYRHPSYQRRNKTPITIDGHVVTSSERDITDA